MHIRLVLFDIDGTLIRSGGAGVRAFAETFATEFKLPNATRNVVFAGRTDVSLVRQILTLNHLEPSKENFSRFFERYPFWLDHFLHKLEGGACEGVREFIAALENDSRKPALGLLTGNIRLGAELKLRRYDLWQHFSTGAFADDNEDRNCIAGVARDRGSKLMGRPLAGEEILVIGDTVHDVECGKSIGAKVLAVGTGGVKVEELKRHEPTWAVKDLREVCATQVLGD
jgi:phosphoglycolate phosphatase